MNRYFHKLQTKVLTRQKLKMPFLKYFLSTMGLKSIGKREVRGCVCVYIYPSFWYEQVPEGRRCSYQPERSRTFSFIVMNERDRTTPKTRGAKERGNHTQGERTEKITTRDIHNEARRGKYWNQFTGKKYNFYLYAK